MISVRLSLLKVMKENGVSQRSMGFFRGRMDKLAGRLVDDDHPVVFKTNIERKGFRLYRTRTQYMIRKAVSIVYEGLSGVNWLAVQTKGA